MTSADVRLGTCKAARRIGQASRSAVNLLDVGRIVLGGEAVKGIESMLSEEIDAAVNGASISRVVRRVRIEPRLIGDTVGAVGAASWSCTATTHQGGGNSQNPRGDGPGTCGRAEAAEADPGPPTPECSSRKER